MTTDAHVGDVFWCESFPGLHGHEEKERYRAIIGDPNRTPDNDGRYLVVPTSSSSLSKHKVRMTTREDHPACRTGLPKACFAVCDEYKLLAREQLTKLAGSISTATVDRLNELVQQVVVERLNKKELDRRKRQGDLS